MKILVPVDGSKFSAAAIDFIATRATLIGRNPSVVLLNVQLEVPARAAQLVGKSAVTTYYEEEAAKATASALAKLGAAGLTAIADFAVGHPAEQIASRAEADQVDLVVMGSHGHGALANLILGSVTNGVLARSKKPLLLLRDHGATPEDSLKVGIAVDGSDYGKAAVQYVLKHRALFGAKPQITVVHVVPDFAGATMPDMAGVALPAYSAEEIKAMQTKAFDSAITPVRELFDNEKVPFTAEALIGPAGDEIAAFAKKKLDLLVMGSHGYGAFKAAVLGSVATRVAAHCITPLLLIRED